MGIGGIEPPSAAFSNIKILEAARLTIILYPLINNELETHFKLYYLILIAKKHL